MICHHSSLPSRCQQNKQRGTLRMQKYFLSSLMILNIVQWIAGCCISPVQRVSTRIYYIDRRNIHTSLLFVISNVSLHSCKWQTFHVCVTNTPWRGILFYYRAAFSLPTLWRELWCSGFPSYSLCCSVAFFRLAHVICKVLVHKNTHYCLLFKMEIDLSFGSTFFLYSRIRNYLETMIKINI